MRFFATRQHLIEAIAEEAQRDGCEVVERNGQPFIVIKVDCECGAASITGVDLAAVAERVWERAA